MQKITIPLTFLMLLLIGTISCTVNGMVDQITGSAGGQNDGYLMEHKRFPIASVSSLDVSTSGGSIAVSGQAQGEAEVEMYVKPGNGRRLSEQQVQEILDQDYEIVIQQSGSALKVHARPKSSIRIRNPLSISFNVKTGNKLNSNLNTSGGSIRLSGLSGNQVFKTSGGSLRLEQLSGTIDGKTSGGSIRVSDSEGQIDLKTSGGSIQLNGLSGRAVVKTSGGSIKAINVQGNLEAKTSGGSISLENLRGNVDAATSGGSIRAQLREVAGPLRLATSGGSISLDIPGSTAANLSLKGSRVNTSGNLNFRGTNKKNFMDGELNGGGAQISATTSAGTVNLNLR